MERTRLSLERGELVERRPRVVHVYPENDMREHNTDNGTSCWCEPTVETHPGGLLVGHHSMDGRELVEAHGLM